MEDYYEVENKEREVWINALNSKIHEQGSNLQIYLGNEIYISDNIIRLLEEGKAATINNTSYVLFEIPLNAEPMNFNDVLFEMLRYKLVPVIAHPERYSIVQKNPDLVYDWIQKGILMQSNYGSIIGQYGKNAQTIVKKLLENDMVHLLGSDVHKEGTVYVKMPEIIRQITELIGDEKFNELSNINPELVLKNKRIDIPEPHHLKLSFIEKMRLDLKN